ncbi:hypothetical protein [Stenotrophomonas indicatrix]|uniref:hypothetical protein n=1 Tax=Stenotrophomonas indicatrix TaxID=2045451 RepID=UPI0028A86AEF|nr:hypothetical protein [Stenotrophomonas indicatrix]
MTTDKTPATLTTAKHGGCVQLGVTVSDEDRAVLQRLQDALPTAGINGWAKGVEVLESLLRQSLGQPSRDGQGNARPQFEEYRGGDCERDAQGYYTNARTAQDWAMWQAALSAQPSPSDMGNPISTSPGGQGDARVAMSEDDFSNMVETVAGEHGEMLEDGAPYNGWCFSCEELIEFSHGIIRGWGWERRAQEYALAARQPVGEQPAIWVSPGQLAAHKDRVPGDGGAYLPARLTKDGQFTKPLYATPPAQAVYLGAVREALQAAEGLATICASVDGYSREELAASGRAMRQQFADALAKVDSQAVGNG